MQLMPLLRMASDLPHQNYAQRWRPFSPLEEVIRRKFLTSLTGQNAFDDVTRELLALPVHLGGLGITNPSAVAAD